MGSGMRTNVRGIVLDVFLGRVSAVFCLERLFPCLDAGLDMCNVHIWNGVRECMCIPINTTTSNKNTGRIS